MVGEICFSRPGLSPDIHAEELEIRDNIGGGGFALVNRAIWHGTPVAVKRFFDPECREEAMSEFNAELKGLRSLRHPHVVQFLGACCEGRCYSLVMVRFVKGSLNDYRREKKGKALAASCMKGVEGN